MLIRCLELTLVEKVKKEQIVLANLNRYFKEFGAQKTIRNTELSNCDFGENDFFYKLKSFSGYKEGKVSSQNMVLEID
jgi:hypothetical protein